MSGTPLRKDKVYQAYRLLKGQAGIHQSVLEDQAQGSSQEVPEVPSVVACPEAAVAPEVEVQVLDHPELHCQPLCHQRDC
jgi:hypothetical protein